MTLRAPFPYFGGKSMAAAEVWARFGDTPNYVEPFFGGGAVLLARPNAHQWWDRIETVNDSDGMVANFWRAVKADPDAVAHWADWPITEPDLHARHVWLVGQRESLQARLEGDPEYYDAKIAGWWVWGICLWIGSGWCSGQGPWRVQDGELVRGDAGQGIHRTLPHLGDAGQGIHRTLPHLGNRGQGINRKRPHLSNPGSGHAAQWSAHLRGMMQELQDRLRRVRVCCGDWTRIMGETPTIRQGLTAVFLDPPYSHTDRDPDLYTVESDISHEVREWAVANGDNPLLRIALCGYEGEHDMPETWERFTWKAAGGYGSQGDGGRAKANSLRERIWFSPHCQRVGRPQQMEMLL